MTPLFANFFGPVQLIIIVVVGVILFGKRLPEIGRSIGKTITEFKKGMGGLEDDLDVAVSKPSVRDNAVAPIEPVRPPQRVAATAPKFEDAPAPAAQSQSPQA